MNEKVTRIVALLFRDVQFSDEVQALHDEVLNNCQDRFADLVRSGLSEEEALSAVTESLKGMEDVLRDYPGKESDSPRDQSSATDPDSDREPEPESGILRLNPSDIHAIRAQLTGCDVEVILSDGECTLEKQGKVFSRMEPDGTLRLWQEKSTDNLFRGISWEESFNSFEHFGDALNRLVRNVTQLVSNGIQAATEESRVILRLPSSVHPLVSLLTTSGSITWQDVVPGAEFSLRSTSGDLQVETDRTYLLPELQVSTTSGDAELRLSAEKVTIATVSGDVDWEGNAHVLRMNSTSGDLDAKGEFGEIAMNSTSGDLNLALTGSHPSRITVNTVSGDIEVRLPDGVQEVTAFLKTVSGDVSRHGVQVVDDAPIRIDAKTVSGDLRFCH